MVHLNNNNGRGFTSQVMLDEKTAKKKNKQKTSLKPY